MNILFLCACLSSCTQYFKGNSSYLNEKNDFRFTFKKMIFKIPDINFVAESMKIKIYNIFLYAFDIQCFNISYHQEDYDQSNSLFIKLQINSSLVNATVYVAKYGVRMKIMAEIDNLTLFLPLQYFKSDDQLIENITTIEDNFYSHLDNFEIIIDSTLSSFVKKYIPLIKESVFETINNNTNSYSLFTHAVEEYGGQLFEKINSCIRSDVNKNKRIKIPISNQKEIIPVIQSPIIDFLRYFLNDLVGDFSNPFNFNNIVNNIIDDSNCLKLSKIGQEFGFDVPIVIKAQETFDFIIKEFSVTGLNTWSNLAFLNPVIGSQYVIDSYADLGDIKINISTELNFTLIDIDDNYSKSSFYTKEIDFFIEFVNNSMDVGLQIAFPKNAGLNYSNSQFLDSDCLLKLVDFNESGISKLHLNTIFEKFDYKMDDDDFFFGLIKFAFDEIVKKNIKIIPKFLNGFIYEVLVINALKDGDNITCTNENVYSNSEMNLKVTLISFGVSVALGIILRIIVIVLSKKKEKKKENENENRIEEELINESAPKKMSKFQLFWRTDEHASLMMHQEIPLWIRIIIPFLLFTNIALFISSNTALAASIIIKFLFGEMQSVYLPSIFDFSLISSVEKLWNANNYFLAILICSLSFIWPFVKLLIMFIVWILPSTVLKFKTRSQILSVLNILGKWSLLDSYLVIMIVIAFHLKINFPIYNVNDIHIPIRLNVFVYPSYGFITLILGTLMSLAISHIICSLNRKISKSKEDDDDHEKSSTIKYSLYKYQNLASNIACVILLAVTLVAFSISLYMKSNSFNVSGYAGWFMDILGKQTEHSFSPIDIGVKYSKSVEFPNTFTVRFTQVIFFLLTIIIPFIHIVSLFIFLFTPFKKKNLLNFYYFNETLYAWSCLDVFFVSLITSHLVIPQMILNAKECKYFKPIAKQSTLRGSGKCFEVSPKIHYGTYLLLSAAVIYTIVNILVFIATKKLTNINEANENKELEIIENE